MAGSKNTSILLLDATLSGILSMSGLSGITIPTNHLKLVVQNSRQRNLLLLLLSNQINNLEYYFNDYYEPDHAIFYYKKNKESVSMC